MVDAYEANAGFPLAFAYTFLVPNKSATAVVVLRHGAFPIALGNAMWEKYKIGESSKILVADDFAIDRLLERGVVFGACNMALQVQSKMLAGNAGVTAEEAAKERAANVIPGVTIIPS